MIKGKEYTEFQFDRTVESSEYYVHVNSDIEYVDNEVIKNYTIWGIADHPEKMITVSDENKVVNFKYKDHFVRNKKRYYGLFGSELIKSEISRLDKLWRDMEHYLKRHSDVDYQNKNVIETQLFSHHCNTHHYPVGAVFIPNNEGRCLIIMATKEYQNPVTDYYVLSQPFDGIHPNHWKNTAFNCIEYRCDCIKERNYTALNFLHKVLRGDLTHQDRTFDKFFREERMSYDQIQQKL